jgi:enterochelin esterase-like enzyme
VRFFWGFLILATAWGQPAAPTAAPTIQQQVHFSQVMNANRAYRVFLPATYAASQKRYPVLYWFHGYESSAEVNAYSKDISDYLLAHVYVQELMDQIDHTLRTVADRDNRGVSGYSAGRFPRLLRSRKIA